MLSPVPEQDGGWRFHLSVDVAGLFLHAVKMANALGDTFTPFLFHGKDSVVSTLRGVDFVETVLLRSHCRFKRCSAGRLPTA
jgi:hypothetical protein